jgi:hypothetical protein
MSGSSIATDRMWPGPPVVGGVLAADAAVVAGPAAPLVPAGPDPDAPEDPGAAVGVEVLEHDEGGRVALERA